jgi:uncharacterized membrane protein YcaP (DUF421 family)
VLLSKDVRLLEGVLAFLVLAVCQFCIAWISLRSRTIQEVVASDPRILLCDGVLDQDALLDERVTEADVRSAVRKEGHGDLSNIAAVFLETDGSFSVIAVKDAGSRSAFPADN